MSKLGGTIYECSDVTFDDGFNYFIPNSLLSELRRLLVEALNNPSNPCSDTAGHTVLSVSSNEPVPRYAYSYLYNIANRLSRDFYHTDAISAYEIKSEDGPVMQCRHCLRYALGYCVKHGGKHPAWKEPLSLRLADGRQFRLEFDCKNCQMNVYAG